MWETANKLEEVWISARHKNIIVKSSKNRGISISARNEWGVSIPSGKGFQIWMGSGKWVWNRRHNSPLSLFLPKNRPIYDISSRTCWKNVKCCRELHPNLPLPNLNWGWMNNQLRGGIKLWNVSPNLSTLQLHALPQKITVLWTVVNYPSIPALNFYAAHIVLKITHYNDPRCVHFVSFFPPNAYLF